MSVQGTERVSPAQRVLLILPYEAAAFMAADVRILSQHFSLEIITHNRGKRLLFLGVLRRLIQHRPAVVLMWFIVPSYALPVTLIAKAFGARICFITGGFDVVSMPRIGFGAMRYPLFRFLLKVLAVFADLFLPFSYSSARLLRKYCKPRKEVVVYPGVDTNFFTPGDSFTKERLAVTVSPVTEASIAQKGLRSFVDAARFAPDFNFVLVGVSPDGSIENLRRDSPPNVEFIDRFIPGDELRSLFRKAACYVQASAHEGFGVAVAEAMSCGAVPVVTPVFSLPEVTSGLGYFIRGSNPQMLADAVKQSFGATQVQRAALRSRVLENFTLAKRESSLVGELRKLGAERRRIARVSAAVPGIYGDGA